MFDINLDIKNVRKFVESEKFSQFLLANTVDFSTAAWILSVLLNELDKYELED